MYETLPEEIKPTLGHLKREAAKYNDSQKGSSCTNHRTIDIKDRESSTINLAVGFVPGIIFRLGEILLDTSDEDF
ncbi:hypothetical protein PS6_001017 [Mucor atramentarius]